MYAERAREKYVVGVLGGRFVANRALKMSAKIYALSEALKICAPMTDLRWNLRFGMGKLLPSSLSCRWLNMKIMSTYSNGRSMCSGGESVGGRVPTCRRHGRSPFALVNLPGRGNLFVGNGQWRSKAPGPFVSARVYMSQDFQNPEARYKVKSSSSAEGVRVLTTNVSVNFTQHIVQLDGKELQHPDPNGSSGNVADRQSSEEFTDLVTSAVQPNAVDETIDATYSGTAEENLLPVSGATAQAQKGKWWHIPDEIADVLPLPADFEERLEVLFSSFGCQIDSRELLLRVLVHKSYYDQRVPADIKEREYRKPQGPVFIDSGEVKQEHVEGLPLRTVSCMTFGDAHGEVRSQLAILGDAVICLAVSSLLVHQHSSAGTVTERKCQLVSNSNLSRVWRTLLGPQEFILSFGDSASQPAALSRMMADSCEAYIGGLYTEKGFETASDTVTKVLWPLLVRADSVRNPVHALNAHSSTVFQVLPEYRLIGVDNKNTQHQVCRVRVYVKGYRMATGMGINQKLARVDAARKALHKWPTVFKVA